MGDFNLTDFKSTDFTTGVTQNVSVSGLLPSTVYYIHYVQEDAAGNKSNVISSVSFTTDASGAIPMAQARSLSRLLQSRIFGRIN